MLGVVVVATYTQSASDSPHTMTVVNANASPGNIASSDSTANISTDEVTCLNNVASQSSVPCSEYMTSQQCPDEVVVSGISCRLPQSENMQEFRDNLMNGVDMVTEDDSRWPLDMYDLPRRSGKLKDLTKFDAAFFGVHPKQANRMDPQLRMLLEVSYEAIVDAGVNPTTIRGSRTGVFVGRSGSECHDAWSRDPTTTVGYTITGCTSSMLPNRLAFYFDFKGPSFAMDTACSSSLLALDRALHSIRSGECDAALVAGTNLCLNPGVAAQFQKLGMLSPEGKCKAFDKEGNGYCRSEGIVAIYIQKHQIAKRIYCTLVHSKTNCDGYKENGITFPSGAMQKELLEEVYTEAGINPATVAYVEAHGTGTKAGDPQEVNTLCDVFCKDRTDPLLIGSVKSNMGHGEPVSGLAALAKVIIAMEEGSIPGNLHFNEPNPDISGLVNGQLKVNNKTSTWQGGIVGINSFGFGGSNVHVILKSHAGDKQQSTPEDKDMNKRLLIYASRTEEAVHTTLEAVCKHADDQELHALLHESANMSTASHPYRGFTILNSADKIHVQKSTSEARPVWFVFSGVGTQWPGMGKKMMEMDAFRSSILKSDVVLKPYNINLYEMLMTADEKTFDNITNSFIGIVAIQVALVDVLYKMGIKPDGILGHSVGEIACAYADGCLTSEEAVLTAYWRGQCVERAKLPSGAMAAVGLSWEDAIAQCPEGVVAACHNSADTVTVSGELESVQQFVNELRNNGTFAKEVNSAGVAFHSHHMKDVGEAFKSALKEVITGPRQRTPRWVSSSIPQDRWESDLARWSSADYHANNVVSPVLFHDALQQVPDNAVVIEIAPHALLQAILRRSLSKNCSIAGLMKKGHEDNVDMFLSNLGRCYVNGMNLNPSLLSSVRYPVSRSTPMISPMLRWDHSQTWDEIKHDMFLDGGAGMAAGVDIDVSVEGGDHYLMGHVIDGRAIFPGTGYMMLAWKQLAKLNNKQFDEMAVSFQDVQFRRATVLPEDGKLHFDISLMPGTGYFEIYEDGAVVSTGRITVVDEWTDDDVNVDEYDLQAVEMDTLKPDDIYTELRLRGFDYGPTFQGIKCADITGCHCRLKWTGNWVTYLDAMLQMTILAHPGRYLGLPTRIESVTIDPSMHKSSLNQTGDESVETTAHIDTEYGTCACSGIIIKGLQVTPTKRRHVHGNPILEQYGFIPSVAPSPVEYPPTLQTYANMCSARAFAGLSMLLKLRGNNGLKNKDEIKATLENVCEILAESTDNLTMDDGNKYGYMEVLTKIFDADYGHTFMEDAADVITKSADALKSDPLSSHLFQPEYLKPCIDIAVQNVLTPKVRIMELNDTGMLECIKPLLLPRTLLDPIYTCASTDKTETFSGVEHLEWSLSDMFPATAKKGHLLIANNMLHNQPNIANGLINMLECVGEDGFLLVREQTYNFHIALPLDGMGEDMSSIFEDSNDRSCGRYCTEQQWQAIFARAGLNIIYQRSDGFMSTLFLLKRSCTLEVEKQTVVDVTALDYSWLETVKLEMDRLHHTPAGENLWLVADSDINGIMGMTTCLRLESGGDKIRCVFNMDKGKALDMTQSLPELCKRDLVMNVFKDGQWGTYQFTPLCPVQSEDAEHAYVNVMNRGDMSSLRWVQSPLKFHQPDANTDMYRVHYASLNFRDVMLASGKLSPHAIPGGLENQDCLYGMEFSGHNSAGERIMGLVPFKGLATTVDVRKNFVWRVPESWLLEQAATIPVVYTTAYYALVVRGNLSQGDRVLIHSGTGGVGQAAISIAIHFGCEVFTTVGSTEKREFLKQRFPQLSDDRIFNSRDTKFEKKIAKATHGKGVNVVLNSLAGEKLQASLRVLAQHGRFLEIGKVDLSENTALGMSLFLKNVSFHGILLDALFEEGNSDWEIVSRHLSEGIKAGVVQPLQTSVFERDNVEAAFRYMAQGKHIGKVLVKVRDGDIPSKASISAMPRTICDPEKCYIITGGLGGVGLELAHWLVDRGARCLILTSRTGVRTGHQTRSIRYMESRGVDVIVSTRNICSFEETESLVTETNGKPVGGIFHLAMVLKDGYLESQNMDTFHAVCDPKVLGVNNLDKVSRELCKETCDWFVVFSSLTGGRGNAGQSMYGFGNSVMERVCERRKHSGLHALAIQWAAIGEVGSAWENENDASIVGTREQSLVTVFEALDTFMCQDVTVVSSWVPSLKNSSGPLSMNHTDLLSAVCSVLGITDPGTVDADTNLANIGLDSMMNAEVQNTLEHFDLTLSIREIRQLTVNKLRKMASEVRAIEE